MLLFEPDPPIVQFSRTFSMPNAETFSMKPVADFIARWIPPNAEIVDPFARNKKLATMTNDLNPETTAEYHLEAEEFCKLMLSLGKRALLGLFDPPYSPRQISECYKSVGLAVGVKETQNAALYKRVRDAMDKLIVPRGVVLSFGWNSNGMGKGRGYQLEEILVVHHGGAHNDTICIAERKMRATWRNGTEGLHSLATLAKGA